MVVQTNHCKKVDFSKVDLPNVKTKGRPPNQNSITAFGLQSKKIKLGAIRFAKLSCKEKKKQLLKFCIEDDEEIDLLINGDKEISKREIPKLVIKTDLYNVGIRINELPTVMTPAAFQLLKDIIGMNLKNMNYLCS